MSRKHESWRLQEIAAKKRRQDSIDQKSQAEIDKIKAGNELEAKRDYQRKQQLKADREAAMQLAMDEKQAYRTAERDRIEKQSIIRSHKKRANISVAKQKSLHVLPERGIRGKLRAQPKPRPVAKKQSIEERRALAKQQVKNMGVYGQR